MFNFEELDAGTPAAEIFTQPTSEETTQENEPNTSWTWRCLTCDSGECSWADGGWRCSQCGSTKFYRTNAAVEKNNEQGIWRFLPFGAEGVQPSRSRRRRRRRANGPDPSDPFGFDLGETAESEVLTNDPEIDPEDDMARGPQGHSGRPLHVPPPPQPRSGQEGPRALLHGKGKGRQPSDGGSAGSSDGQLLSALRKLVAKKDDDSEWSAMSGPQRGVRWRGGAPPLPPTWRYDKDDLRAYTKFVKKVEIWKLQVAPYMSKKEMALSLYNSLQGEAEQELEHTPIEDLYVDDGVAKILEALKGPMEQKVVYQKRKFLSEFENLRRYAGESMRSYVNRFRRTQRCLKSVRSGCGTYLRLREHGCQAFGSQWLVSRGTKTCPCRDTTTSGLRDGGGVHDAAVSGVSCCPSSGDQGWQCRGSENWIQGWWQVLFKAFYFNVDLYGILQQFVYVLWQRLQWSSTSGAFH